MNKFIKLHVAIAGLLLTSVLATSEVAGAVSLQDSAKERSAVAANCATSISEDGHKAYGLCTWSAPGTQFRLVMTVCGPGHCQTTRSSWWNQDSRWHTFSTGGYIASVDDVEVLIFN